MERRKAASSLRVSSSRQTLGKLSVSGNRKAPFSNPKHDRKYSTHSFGAHFVEVTWDPGIARLRVTRVVTVIDGGRILNQLAACNQIEAAVVMGIGMALFEETRYDPETGRPVNDNLADYCMTVNADTPPIDGRHTPVDDFAFVISAADVWQLNLD